MNLSCRFGWHNWGRWSNYWISNSYDWGNNRVCKVYRSLKCKDCGKEKHKHLETLMAVCAAYNNPVPTWEETQ